MEKYPYTEKHISTIGIDYRAMVHDVSKLYTSYVYFGLEITTLASISTALSTTTTARLVSVFLFVCNSAHSGYIECNEYTPLYHTTFWYGKRHFYEPHSPLSLCACVRAVRIANMCRMLTSISDFPVAISKCEWYETHSARCTEIQFCHY